MRRALVTGGAGFIGSHLVDRLMDEGGWEVTVVDNFDPYYSPDLKRRNIERHLGDERFTLVEVDIRDHDSLRRTITGPFDVVVHLAARAGVRPSVENPRLYHEVNILGTQNVLDLARDLGVPRVVFGSSSSVYGVNPNLPWREDAAPMPVSPYGASKAAAELLGGVYSRLYGIQFISLRLFTVYGPRQRPDLAISKFARLMLEGKPLPVYGDGSSRRDYTYVGDAVRAIRAAMASPISSLEVINVGSGRAISLGEAIHCLEEVLGTRAALEHLPSVLADVPETFADTEKARTLLGYQPEVPFADGVRSFACWMRASFDSDSTRL